MSDAPNVPDHCIVCAGLPAVRLPLGPKGAPLASRVGEVVRVRSNIRQFRTEYFDVWRCGSCGCLHSTGEIDYARYYRAYPMQRQPLDFFSRRLFATRLAYLQRAGLKPGHRILDYGCGNGIFVRYLHERGFVRAQGYDPYSERFADRGALAESYDCVTSQDVIEHVPDPYAYVDELSALVKRPGGMLAIGTPNAEHIDLHDPVDHVGQLHQPHHRHILTGAALQALIRTRGFAITSVVPRFYADTWVPFANSLFLFRYMAALDGTVDAGFDPIRTNIILRSPVLLWYGLFGRLYRPRKDILVTATAQ